MGELILMNLCRPAFGVQVFLRHSVYITSRAKNAVYYAFIKKVNSSYQLCETFKKTLNKLVFIYNYISFNKHDLLLFCHCQA